MAPHTIVLDQIPMAAYIVNLLQHDWQHDSNVGAKSGLKERANLSLSLLKNAGTDIFSGGGNNMAGGRGKPVDCPVTDWLPADLETRSSFLATIAILIIAYREGAETHQQNTEVADRLVELAEFIVFDCRDVDPSKEQAQYRVFYSNTEDAMPREPSAFNDGISKLSTFLADERNKELLPSLDPESLNDLMTIVKYGFIPFYISEKEYQYIEEKRNDEQDIYQGADEDADEDTGEDADEDAGEDAGEDADEDTKDTDEKTISLKDFLEKAGARMLLTSEAINFISCCNYSRMLFFNSTHSILTPEKFFSTQSIVLEFVGYGSQPLSQEQAFDMFGRFSERIQDKNLYDVVMEYTLSSDYAFMLAQELLTFESTKLMCIKGKEEELKAPSSLFYISGSSARRRNLSQDGNTEVQESAQSMFGDDIVPDAPPRENQPTNAVLVSELSPKQYAAYQGRQQSNRGLSEFAREAMGAAMPGLRVGGGIPPEMTEYDWIHTPEHVKNGYFGNLGQNPTQDDIAMATDEQRKEYEEARAQLVALEKKWEELRLAAPAAPAASARPAEAEAAEAATKDDSQESTTMNDDDDDDDDDDDASFLGDGSFVPHRQVAKNNSIVIDIRDILNPPADKPLRRIHYEEINRIIVNKFKEFGDEKADRCIAADDYYQLFSHQLDLTRPEDDLLTPGNEGKSTNPLIIGNYVVDKYYVFLAPCELLDREKIYRAEGELPTELKAIIYFQLSEHEVDFILLFENLDSDLEINPDSDNYHTKYQFIFTYKQFKGRIVEEGDQDALNVDGGALGDDDVHESKRLRRTSSLPTPPKSPTFERTSSLPTPPKSPTFEPRPVYLKRKRPDERPQDDGYEGDWTPESPSFSGESQTPGQSQRALGRGLGRDYPLQNAQQTIPDKEQCLEYTITNMLSSHTYVFNQMLQSEIYYNFYDYGPDILSIRKYFNYSSAGYLPEPVDSPPDQDDGSFDGGSGPGNRLFKPYTEIASVFNVINTDSPISDSCSDKMKNFVRLFLGFYKESTGVECVYPDKEIKDIWKAHYQRITGVQVGNSFQSGLPVCKGLLDSFFTNFESNIDDVDAGIKNNSIGDKAETLKPKFIATPATNIDSRYFSKFLEEQLTEIFKAIVYAAPVDIVSKLKQIKTITSKIANGFSESFTIEVDGAQKEFKMDKDTYDRSLFTLPDRAAEFKALKDTTDLVKLGLFNIYSGLAFSYIEVLSLIINNSLSGGAVSDSFKYFCEKAGVTAGNELKFIEDVVSVLMQCMKQFNIQSQFLLRSKNGKARSLSTNEIKNMTFVSASSIVAVQNALDLVRDTDTGGLLFNTLNPKDDKKKLLYNEVQLMKRLLEQSPKNPWLGGKNSSKIDEEGFKFLVNYLTNENTKDIFRPRKPPTPAGKKALGYVVDVESDWALGQGQLKGYIPVKAAAFPAAIRKYFQKYKDSVTAGSTDEDAGNIAYGLAVIWKTMSKFALDNTGCRENNATQLSGALYGVLGNGDEPNLAAPETVAEANLAYWNTALGPGTGGKIQQWKNKRVEGMNYEKISSVLTACNMAQYADACPVVQCNNLNADNIKKYGLQYGEQDFLITNKPGASENDTDVMSIRINLKPWVGVGTPCDRDGQTPRILTVRVFARIANRVIINIGNLPENGHAYNPPQTANVSMGPWPVDNNPDTNGTLHPGMPGIYVDLKSGKSPFQAEVALMNATREVLKHTSGMNSWNNYVSNKLTDFGVCRDITSAGFAKAIGDNGQELSSWFKDGGYVTGPFYNPATANPANPAGVNNAIVRTVARPCPTKANDVGQWDDATGGWGNDKKTAFLANNLVNCLSAAAIAPLPTLDGLTFLDGQDQPSGYRNLLVSTLGRNDRDGLNPWILSGYSHQGHNGPNYHMKFTMGLRMQSDDGNGMFGGSKPRKTRKNKKVKKQKRSRLQNKKRNTKNTKKKIKPKKRKHTRQRR